MLKECRDIKRLHRYREGRERDVLLITPRDLARLLARLRISTGCPLLRSAFRSEERKVRTLGLINHHAGRLLMQVRLLMVALQILWSFECDSWRKERERCIRREASGSLYTLCCKIEFSNKALRRLRRPVFFPFLFRVDC